MTQALTYIHRNISW